MQDVIIIGAGPAGLCLARSLSQLGLEICVIDKQPKNALVTPAIDGRDIALTHFSQSMLEKLGIWQHLPQENISIIRKAQIFDGQSTYSMDLSPSDKSTVGIIAPNHLIRSASYTAIKDDPSISLIDSATLKKVEINSNNAKVILDDGREVTAKLIVAADSRFSETRRHAGISANMHDFGKTMIVCQMAHDYEHNGIAHECFNYGHTLAVLPLNGNRSSVIITLTPTEAAGIMAMQPSAFNQWVAQQFKHRLGTMRLDSQRFDYPLIGVYAEQFVAKRFVLAGDAAVGMHPVTAHGFNFGLKSVHFLTREVHRAMQKKRDIGSADVLANYERHNRHATRPLYLATNSIVGLYTNDGKAAKVFRKALLHLANNMLPVKYRLMSKLAKMEAPTLLPRPVTALRRLIKTVAS